MEMQINNEINNLNQDYYLKRKHKKKYYSLVRIPINLNDGVSAIDLFQDSILVGTYMGSVKVCIININPNSNEVSQEDIKVTKIIDSATENISCISFESRYVYNIAIGDFEILHINTVNDGNSANFVKIRNYPSENEHIKYCEQCTCFMTDEKFFKVNTEFPENNDGIKKVSCKYENKSLTKQEMVVGTIDIMNYSVPFDYDGDKFLWVDYLLKDKRRICVYNASINSQNKLELEYIIGNKFGHISHMKFIRKEAGESTEIFLVKNKIQCEIRSICTDFTLINSFVHIGDEVISSCIYIRNNLSDNTVDSNKLVNNSINEINTNNQNFNRHDLFLKISNNNDPGKSNTEYVRSLNLNENNSEKKTIHNFNFNANQTNYNNNVMGESNRNSKDWDNSFMKKDLNSNSVRSSNLLNDVQEINICNINKVKDNTTYSIGTLDYGGNFNVFENNEEKTMFNLYNIKNIKQEYKDLEFFSIGYPYFIKFNDILYAISTDHGVFVITKDIVCK